MKIQSSLSPGQCIALLKSSTVKDSAFGTLSLKPQTIIAKINGSKFRLRETRSYRNSFAPFFFGEMKSNGSGTEIEGGFRLHSFVLVFMTIWFGGLGLFTLVALAQYLGLLKAGHSTQAGGSGGVVVVFAPMLMALFGYGMVRFGDWLARNEKVRIARYLETTFSDEARALAASSPPPSENENAKPSTMWGAILIFSGLGLMSVIFGFTGISSIETARTPMVAHLQDRWGQGLAVISGIFLLLLAYGIRKRLRAAWFMGFALIALGAINFVFTMWGDSQTIAPRDSPVAFVISGIVGALAVGAYWTFWWYKKRDYFYSKPTTHPSVP